MIETVKQYRKRPVSVYALRFDGNNADKARAWMNASKVNAGYNPEDRSLSIETLEGVMKANEGDFIIQGVNGEFYPCKPDIFLKTYEQVGG